MSRFYGPRAVYHYGDFITVKKEAIS